MAELVLASSSPHRRELLARLGLPFDVQAPEVDETPLPDETPEDLVARLSELKARAVAAHRPGALIIGSDQIASVPTAPRTSGQYAPAHTPQNDHPNTRTEPPPTILGKPRSRSAAIEQLRMLSGQSVDFLTGLCVLSPAGGVQVEVERTQVRFRNLADPEIVAYVEREQPFGCAASFRSERLGIALVDAIHSTDPTALVGLPLIRLCRMLKQAGLQPLEHRR